jgi:hypothetical protein
MQIQITPHPSQIGHHQKKQKPPATNADKDAGRCVCLGWGGAHAGGDVS